MANVQNNCGHFLGYNSVLGNGGHLGTYVMDGLFAGDWVSQLKLTAAFTLDASWDNTVVGTKWGVVTYGDCAADASFGFSVEKNTTDTYLVATLELQTGVLTKHILSVGGVSIKPSLKDFFQVILLVTQSHNASTLAVNLRVGRGPRGLCGCWQEYHLPSVIFNTYSIKETLCFANFFHCHISSWKLGQFHRWTDMDETNQTCCIDIICILHRWESEMGSSQHKWPHQARAFWRGIDVVTSSRHTNDAVRIFTYEYLSEKTLEMGWSHTSRSESQQHECENIINRMHLFIVSRVIPTEIGNKFISEYVSKFQNMESCISWRPNRYLAWDVVIYNIKLSPMHHHQTLFSHREQGTSRLLDMWVILFFPFYDTLMC